MASFPAEDNIYEGIGTGEAQVFKPYDQPSAQDQANLAIEKDRIGRIDLRNKEEAARIANHKGFERKIEGIIPGMTRIVTDMYGKLKDTDIKANLTKADQSLDYKTNFAREVAYFDGFLGEMKQYSDDFNNISKLYREGKLTDEGNKIYEERLTNPDYYTELAKSGKTLPEISGMLSADFKSMQVKPESDPWTNASWTKKPEPIFQEKGGHNKETGLITENKVIDEAKTMQTAQSDWDKMTQMQKDDMLLNGPEGVTTPEEAVNWIYNDKISHFNSKNKYHYATKSPFESIGFGDGTKVINGILPTWRGEKFNVDRFSEEGGGEIRKYRDATDENLTGKGVPFGVLDVSYMNQGGANKENEYEGYDGNKIVGKIKSLYTSSGLKEIIISKTKNGRTTDVIVPLNKGANRNHVGEFLKTDYDTFIKKALSNSGTDVQPDQNVSTSPKQKNTPPPFGSMK